MHNELAMVAAWDYMHMVICIKCYNGESFMNHIRSTHIILLFVR